MRNDFFIEIRPQVQEIVNSWTTPDDEAFWDLGASLWERDGVLGVGYFFSLAINAPIASDAPISTSVLMNDPRSLLDNDFANKLIKDCVEILRSKYNEVAKSESPPPPPPNWAPPTLPS